MHAGALAQGAGENCELDEGGTGQTMAEVGSSTSHLLRACSPRSSQPGPEPPHVLGWGRKGGERKKAGNADTMAEAKGVQSRHRQGAWGGQGDGSLASPAWGPDQAEA